MTESVPATGWLVVVSGPHFEADTPVVISRFEEIFGVGVVVEESRPGRWIAGPGTAGLPDGAVDPARDRTVADTESRTRNYNAGEVLPDIETAAAPDAEPAVFVVKVFVPDDQHAPALIERLGKALLAAGYSPPQVDSLPLVDWGEAWEQEHRPLRVGRRLLIQNAKSTWDVSAPGGAAGLDAAGAGGAPGDGPTGASGTAQSTWGVSAPGDRAGLDAAGAGGAPGDGSTGSSGNAQSTWDVSPEARGTGQGVGGAGRAGVRGSGETGADAACADGLAVVRIAPGMAFGVGSHVTTRLCLGRLETLVKGGEVVLDVGAGTGILAIAAVRLGAKRAVALDIDPNAAAAIARNAALNGVAGAVVPVLGPVAAVAGNYPLVVANIVAWVILDSLPRLASRVAPDGRLLLSGIFAEHETRVVAALATHGFQPLAVDREEGFVAIVAGRGR